jgi:solute carrier family 13 (sodium-dependent dicarboxylate transporter), member 2/3/5
VKRGLVILGALAGSVTAYAMLPEMFGELERRAAAILVSAAVFWASRVIPLFATSLLVVISCILLLAEDGGFAREGGIEADRFLAKFGSDIIMLFLGGLALSVALSEHGLDRAIATRVLRPFVRRPLVLIYAVMGITAFFSMWMSNTATTAMMLAIVASLLRAVPKENPFGTGLVLAVALGANIGGIGTPIGTPPNAIALSALRDAGYEVSFLRWMLMASPLAILLLAMGGLVIHRFYARGKMPELHRAMQAVELTWKSWATLGIVLFAIAAWLTSGLHGVADGVVALSAAVLLATLGLLRGAEFKKIEWPVLILMWGGLTLGLAMELTGLVGHFGDLPLAKLPRFALTGIVVALGLGLSMFISNTATAALLVPIVLALAVPEEGLLIVVTALACSFAMAMPVSTPPNALTYSTGRIDVPDLVRVGGLMGIIAIVLMLAGYRIMVPLALPVGP